MGLMAGRKLRDGEGGRLFFQCPGCKTTHMIQHGHGPGPRWTWNGNPEKPTFAPSVLVTGYEDQTEVWRCHSFVRDGRIQFLGDCSHDLAGTTVDLPCFDDE